MKVATRNNLLKKLDNSNARTIRTTALALCYSIVECAAPVWRILHYADLLDPELNKACLAITGCLKPTYVEDLYLLAGNGPTDIRRYVCARMEQTKQMEQETHLLFGQVPARSHLKSRKDFLTNVKPFYFPAKVVRCNEWQRRSRDKSQLGMVNLNEPLAKAYDSHWLTWRCLKRLRTGYTCSKEQRKKWGYFNGDTCACGLDEENTVHMLRCSLFTHPCTLDDLLKFNDIGYKCTEQWKRKVW